jgi:CubicO group peptidase (beta-lactamase class C family)
VQRLTGKTLAEIARTGLFEPMGITDELWTPNSDGTSEGSHGLFLTPRDMAKIGQLALQKGAWNGRQLVSEDWIGQSTSSQTPTPPQGPYVTDYGFFWWVLPEQDAFTAWGHGGQYIYVLPEQDMVVVMTSMPSVNDDNVGTTLSKFVPLAQQIADAVIP